MGHLKPIQRIKNLIKSSWMLPIIFAVLPACNAHKEQEDASDHEQIIVTTPESKDVIVTQRYVCQIHSQRHIPVRALEPGYLEAIPVKEGQAVKKDQVMFTVIPVLYQARLDAEQAEADLARTKYNQTVKLCEDKVVSDQEVKLAKAQLDKAVANVSLAKAELNFTYVKAPFDGIIDRLMEQQGSLVKEGDILTTLSDNTIMWVYFNVPEKRYLEYMQGGYGKRIPGTTKIELVDSSIDLILADGSRFNYSAGNSVTVEGKVNNDTGNIAFRADFPNHDRLLRHGQTGNILIHRTVHNALVIPQKATFEILDQRYVWVLDSENKAERRKIDVEHEMDDIFIIKPLQIVKQGVNGEEKKTGLTVDDKIVLEGIRQVHAGDKVEYEFVKPEDVLAHLKNHAE